MNNHKMPPFLYMICTVYLFSVYLTKLDCNDVLVPLLVPYLKFKVVGEMAALSNLEHNILAWVDTGNPEVGRKHANFNMSVVSLTHYARSL
uniref:Uncharacterized protein n=1 Tax=Arundo donax TaxID=35708 RepID=A0A0A9H5E1_ARUDO